MAADVILHCLALQSALAHLHTRVQTRVPMFSDTPGSQFYTDISRGATSHAAAFQREGDNKTLAVL